MTTPPVPLALLNHWAQQLPDRIWLRQPQQRQLRDLSWQQVKQQMDAIANALHHLGLGAGDKVAILSKNCAEWFIVDLALQAAHLISVPIFPTASTNTVRYILQHSDTKAIFLGKLDNPDDFEHTLPPGLLRLHMNHPSVTCQYQWQQLVELGTERPKIAPTTPLAATALMTLIYTSGSTGNPKGAQLTYAAYATATQIIATELKASQQDRLISYLPLAHITERSYIQGSALHSGATVYFVENQQTFLLDIQATRPTLFLSVPRLWTVFRENILTKVGAVRLALLLKIPLLHRLVARKIRTQLGLDQARMFGCGSAPVAPALLHWYRRIGIPISEAWGMTENSGLGTLNAPFNFTKIGTVGHPAQQCSVRLGEHQELLFKSPALFSGYYKDETATAAAFTDDGYFKTGDQAEIDSDGYVRITGRLKDAFKTAKGKYVAPVPIEHKLAQNSVIELLCIIGAGAPAPVALIQLTEHAKTLPKTEIEHSLSASIHRLNQHLERHEQLGGMLIMASPWTVENELLTPTLKIKRHQLEALFSEQISHIRHNTIHWQAS